MKLQTSALHECSTAAPLQVCSLCSEQAPTSPASPPGPALNNNNRPRLVLPLPAARLQLQADGELSFHQSLHHISTHLYLSERCMLEGNTQSFKRNMALTLHLFTLQRNQLLHTNIFVLSILNTSAVNYVQNVLISKPKWNVKCPFILMFRCSLFPRSDKSRPWLLKCTTVLLITDQTQAYMIIQGYKKIYIYNH